MTMENETTGTTPKRGCQRWIKLALIGSLALNVGIAGLFIGNAMKEEERPRGPYKQIEWIIRLVPETKRDFTMAHFESQKAQMKEIRASRRKHMEMVLAAIRAEPFQPEALEAALANRRTASMERRSLMHNATVSLLTQFSADERAVFAENVQKRLVRWVQRQEK